MKSRKQNQTAWLGPYEITGILGRGGMGIVYRGVHSDTQAQFAIKTVRVPSHHCLVALRREILALSRLSHPGVIAIVDRGVTQGLPWYAMPLLTGNTLADLISSQVVPTFSTIRANRSQALELDRTLPATELPTTDLPATDLPAIDLKEIEPPTEPSDSGVQKTPAPVVSRTELLGVLGRVCKALAYLHSNGFVHRDLKPSNVFVMDSLAPVIVDFGVATSFPGAGGTERVDAVSHVGGSAAYMSPEQIAGEFVDARSDLYSIGCILYECLTGRVPFSGKSKWDVLNGHLYSEPLAPSRLRGDIPDELEALALRLLAKQPQNRLGHADLVERTLVQHLGDQRAEANDSQDRAYLYRPSFVSNDRLDGLIQRLLVRLAQGDGGVLLLSGESGAGKTRTAMEAAARAQRMKLKVVVGGCVPLTSSSPRDGILASLRPLLHLIADTCHEGGENVIAQLLGTRARALATLDDSFSSFVGSNADPIERLPAEVRLRHLVQAICETIMAYAHMQTTLLIVDDLQWADELSLTVLEELCNRCDAGVPLGIVGTHRIEETTDRLQHLIRNDSVTRHALPALNRAEIEKMVAGMLALDRVPDSLLDYVTRRSDGNPFFASEYLMAHIESGVLGRNSLGQWVLNQDLSGDHLLEEQAPPERIRDLFLRRVHNLEETARNLITVASVLGRDIPPEWLRLGVGITDDEFIDALQTLRTRQILVDKNDGFLAFSHDQLRSFIYESMGRDMKVSLHTKVAEVIGALTEGGVVPTALLAHHWTAARRPDIACGYWRQAAHDVRETLANHEAIRYFRRALEAAENARASNPERATHWSTQAQEIAESLGDCEALAANFLDATVVYQRALSSFGDVSNVGRARLDRKTAKVHSLLKEHERALHEYDAAARALSSVPPQERDPQWWCEWIELQIERAWTYYWKGQISELMALIEECRPQLHHHGSPVQRARLLSCLLNATMRGQRYRLDESTLRLAREAHTEAVSANELSVRCETRFGLAFALLFSDRLDEAAQELKATLREAQLLGDTPVQVRSLTYLSIVERRLGNAKACDELSRNLLEMANSAQMTDYLGAAHGNLAWIAWREKRLRDVREHGDTALRAWERPPAMYPFQWLARWPLAAAAHQAGEHDEAARHLEALSDPKQEALASEPRELVSRLARRSNASPPFTQHQVITQLLSFAELDGKL